jgi:hypothetical protein
MNQKELIKSLKQLKEIKPRQEWVILAKSEIFAQKQAEKIAVKNPSILDVIFSLKFQTKLAYSFAAFIFVLVGLVGFAQFTMPGDLLFPIKKIAEQSQTSLSSGTSLKKGAITFNRRISDLAKAAAEGRKENLPSVITEINADASELAKSLKDDTVKDPEAIKEIANSLKVLADVPGTDLSANPNVKDLYKTIVESQISELGNSTLTDSQKGVLTEVISLYEQKKYTEALEAILTINK